MLRGLALISRRRLVASSAAFRLADICEGDRDRALAARPSPYFDPRAIEYGIISGRIAVLDLRQNECLCLVERFKVSRITLALFVLHFEHHPLIAKICHCFCPF